MTNLSDYAVLRDFGHSRAKAAEIALDAKRGDKFAMLWLEIVKELLTEELSQ